jgi:AAA family ATP:ADP antiporter
VLVVLGTVSAAMIDFVFKSQAVGYYGRGENLTRFFAMFYSVTGVLSLVLQMTLSSPALRRLGLAKTVGTLPFAVSLGGLGALVMPGLAAAAFARGMEAVFRGSLFRAGYELFYNPIPRREKRAAKSLVDVGFDRLGDAVGSGLVSIMLNLGPAIASHAILTGAILVALAGVWVASRLSNAYIDALERGLLERAGSLDLDDARDSLAVTGMLESMTVVFPTTMVPVVGRAQERPSQESTRTATPPEPKPASPPHEAPQRNEISPVASSMQSDPIVFWASDLRSGDVHRVRRALQEADPLKSFLVPYAVALLAWDPVYPDAARALRAVAEKHIGHLVDHLLDADTDFTIRRRLPRVLTSAPGPRAVDGLLGGLSDKRFEVRYQCGRALAVCVDRRPALRIEPQSVFDAIRREVAVNRNVWESHRLLDRAEERESSPFIDEFLRNRANRSLEHVFTLLSLVLPSEPLRIAFKGLHTDDAQLRGTSLEYLESILPPDIRDRLWPLLESQGQGERKDARPMPEVLAELMKSDQSILVNLAELRKKPEE